MTDLSTLAVHAGQATVWRGGQPSAPPIIAASGFTYDSMEALDAGLSSDRAGYVYARQNAPTQEAFEAALAALESAEEAVAFSSGMAALHAAIVAAGARAGARFLAAEETYGATKTLLSRLAADAGLSVRFVRIGDLPAVEAALADFQADALVFEILSNPLVRVADARAVIALARRYGARTVVDSTFSTPCLIQPLALGADYVAHSATKYIGGHGDVLAGVVAASAEDCARLRSHRNLVGSNLSPFDAWLCLRGLRTLPLRLRQACANALDLARWLSDHNRVEAVYYPGLEADPDHALAARQFPAGMFGAMLAFDIAAAGRAEAFAVMERLKVAQRIASLGDVGTLVSYPAHASHRSLTPEARAALGIGDGCLRVSVGIEDVRDLIADFAQALDE
jgi:cystathionine gamma-synthase/methionine-gamma-lyase